MKDKPILTPKTNNQPQFPPSALENRGTGFVPITDSNTLETNDSNFVFFFGKPQIGKSAILATLLYYMNARAGTIRPKLSTPNTQGAETLLFDLLDDIKRGKLPSRTAMGEVTRLDMIFSPNNKSKKVKPISLTFLEMSGEDLKTVRRGGKFNDNIDKYLNLDIPLNFLLITDFDNADDDDSLMFSFLNELEKKPRKFKSINGILLVAKWDASGSLSVSHPEQLEQYIKEHMAMTNNQIDNYELAKSYYTVGNVKKNEKGEFTDRLESLDLSTAKMLTEWLYESITGVSLNYEGDFWERIKNQIFG